MTRIGRSQLDPRHPRPSSPSPRSSAVLGAFQRGGEPPEVYAHCHELRCTRAYSRAWRVASIPCTLSLPTSDQCRPDQFHLPTDEPMNTMREAQTKRKTRETDISFYLNVDGRGRADVDTGIGFLDHMLIAIAAHGMFDITVKAVGDLHIDEHHTAEDVFICFGRALNEALGDRRAIVRAAHSYVTHGRGTGLRRAGFRRAPLLCLRGRIQHAACRSTGHRYDLSPLREHRLPESHESACPGALRAQRSSQGRSTLQSACRARWTRPPARIRAARTCRAPRAR